MTAPQMHKLFFTLDSKQLHVGRISDVTMICLHTEVITRHTLARHEWRQPTTRGRYLQYNTNKKLSLTEKATTNLTALFYSILIDDNIVQSKLKSKLN